MAEMREFDRNSSIPIYKQAEDAVLVDTTTLSLEQSAQRIKEIILERTGA